MDSRKEPKEIITIAVSLEERKIIEKAFSVARGNFGLLSLEEERGQALLAMARIVLGEWGEKSQ